MSPGREEALDWLAQGVDVLVVGGGITGAGVALDAASRGYRVGLVERGDYACGTTSRSTRLVHGGIRYLPQGHLGLVRQALRERQLLFRLAPHLVRPIGFLIPLYRGLRAPLGMRLPKAVRPFVGLGVRMGLLLYDAFSRDPAMRHRPLSRREVARLAPGLRTEGLRKAFLYFDGKTDDVRLTHAVLRSARSLGAVTANYAEVKEFLRLKGRVAGAAVLDRLTGKTVEVPARAVVNATGVWAERVAALAGPPPFRIRHSKGTHLVLRPGAVQASCAVVIPETDDGRLAFLVPWADRFVLGTTDEPYTGDLEWPLPSEAEVHYLLDHANRYLERSLGYEDVVATYAGVRPLVVPAEGATAASTAALSRDHVVVVSGGGLITVTGGKLTTYRKMAADAVDAVVRQEGHKVPSRTHRIRLAGADGLEEAKAALGELEPDQREHLLNAYGSLALEVLAVARADPVLFGRLVEGFPYLKAEVAYACRSEQLVSVADCLYLRIRLAVTDARASDSVAEEVARLMARELGWGEEEVSRQLERYRAVRSLEKFT